MHPSPGHRLVRARRVIVAGWAPIILLCASMAPALQQAERFHARLSVVPIDFATSASTSGSGSLTAALEGRQLLVTGTFAGLSSPATAAHLHRAPPGLRGPVVFRLTVSTSASGAVGGDFELTDAQTEDVRDGRFYVQIHTERNPAGEIRGWLLRGGS